RWHTTGRRVRRRDEAEILEIRHDVADRRRAQLEPEVARERARANRLPIADVMLDEKLEQLLRALAQAFFSRIDGVCNHCLLLSLNQPTFEYAQTHVAKAFLVLL